MLTTTSAVRPHDSMKAAAAAIDAAPPARLAVTFCAEWEAQCLADYAADCRAAPEEQLPAYSDYRLDWLEYRLWCEESAAAAEAAQQRAAEREQRQFPAPVYGDDDIPF